MYAKEMEELKAAKPGGETGEGVQLRQDLETQLDKQILRLKNIRARKLLDLEALPEPSRCNETR